MSEPSGFSSAESQEYADPGDGFTFPYERLLHEVFPRLHEAENNWLGAIDSLPAPDRKIHELIRLACTVGIRNEAGVRRHARLAREVGASWPEIAGAVMLTQTAFGVLPAVAALPAARAGYEEAQPAETD